VASGTRERGVYRGAPVARLARRFAVNLKAGDPALAPRFYR
jgi:hypothetical protein